MARRAAQRATIQRPDDPRFYEIVRPSGAVMRSEWVDPDDIRPNAAKTARRIAGYRAFCPLRRMAGIPGTAITEEHIHAADKLREVWDQARLGFSGSGNPLLIAVLTVPQPRTGPGQGEVKRLKAAKMLRRALAVFSLPEQAIVSVVILHNQSIRGFCRAHVARTGRVLDPHETKHRLLVILNKLATHFKSEIEDEVARGRRLPP